VALIYLPGRYQTASRERKADGIDQRYEVFQKNLLHFFATVLKPSRLKFFSAPLVVFLKCSAWALLFLTAKFSDPL